MGSWLDGGTSVQQQHHHDRHPVLLPQVTEGSLFICERGAQFDGHDYAFEVRKDAASASHTALISYKD